MVLMVTQKFVAQYNNCLFAAKSFSLTIKFWIVFKYDLGWDLGVSKLAEADNLTET